MDVAKAHSDKIVVPEEVLVAVVDDSIGRLVKDISEAQRRTLAQLVAAAHKWGWSQDELQQHIEDTVGLDVPRLNAVENHRRKLVADGIPKGVADRRARELARRYRHDRAGVIARNELARLVGESKRRAWELAKEEGLIDQYVVRIWHTAKDEMRCKVCRPMNAQRAAIGRPYKRNGLAGPPVHVNCRCWETLERGEVVLAKEHSLGSDFKYRDLVRQVTT